MKRAETYILFPTGTGAATGWLVARAEPQRSATAPVQLAGGENRDDVARLIAEALGRLGHAGQGVTLAIPSGWCMSVTIDAGGARLDRKGMLFKLEEKVPLAAEELTADFAAPADGAGPQARLAVCSRVDALRPWLEALERAGVAVESVTSAALLAARAAAALATPAATDGNDTLLLIKEGDDVSVVSLRGGRQVAWNLAPRTANGIALQVRLSAFVHPVQDVMAFGLSSEELASLDAGLRVTVVDADADVVALATSLLGNAPHGSRLELRRGPLAVADRYRLVRGSLNAALAAAAVLLLCVAGALFLRAHRYDRQAAGESAQAVQAFREAFPDWPMPASVRAVVESEHRKLGASLPAAVVPSHDKERGQRPANAPPSPQRGSALAMLLQVLAAISDGSGSARFRLDRLSFDAERFELEGDAPTADVVDDLVTACRVAGLAVTSPEVRRSPGGAWTFVLRGGPSAAGVARVSP